MYPVTEGYIEAVSKQIRDPIEVEAELYNVDDYVQNSLEVSTNYFGDLLGDGITDISSEKKKDIASFEQDWLKADGSQVFAEDYAPPYYVGTLALSDTQPDENGEYPLLNRSQLTITHMAGWVNGVKPIMITFGENVRRVRYWVDGSDPAAVVSLDSTKTISVPAELETTEIVVEILTLSKPNQFGRIMGVYAGSRASLLKSSIISVDYSDINDGVAAELPDKSIRLSIDNAGREYQAETDDLSPYFYPMHTQLAFRIRFQSEELPAEEWIPLPVMYLSSYTITDTTVDFVFEDVIWLLNQYNHYWESTQGARFNVRVQEVMKLKQQEGILYDENGQIMTEPEKRGLSIDLTNAKNQLTFCRDTPQLFTASGMLQVLANITLNILRSRRTGQTMEMLQINAANGRRIVLTELFGYPQVTKSDKINAVTLNYVDNRPASGSYEDIKLYDSLAIPSYGIAYPIINTDPNMRFPTAENTAVKRVAAYRYVSYFQADYSPGETMTAIMVSKHVEPTWESQETYQFSDEEGQALVLENPLWYGTEPVKYAQYYFNELSHNLLCTLSHRGFPELDAGDIITVETETRPSVKARILENHFSVSGGAMSGSTKVRLLE